MALVREEACAVFDLTQIRCGYLVWGRHVTWKEGKAGFITSATERELIVQYYPGIGNVTNHFRVPVSEVTEGQWELRCSVDLSVIEEYPAKSEEKEKGSSKGASGGIDL